MAHKVAIIAASPEHIAHIAANVRPEDDAELALLSIGPARAVHLSLQSALIAWTGTVDDVPVCMFGVSPGELGEGRPWMIGTKDLDRFAMIFLRRNKAKLKEMLDVRPVLANYVSVKNTRAIAWLTWLGFSFEPPVLWGHGRQPFQRFELRRQS